MNALLRQLTEKKTDDLATGHGAHQSSSLETYGIVLNDKSTNWDDPLNLLRIQVQLLYMFWMHAGTRISYATHILCIQWALFSFDII